jgi:hypothetical protein
MGRSACTKKFSLGCVVKLAADMINKPKNYLANP